MQGSSEFTNFFGGICQSFYSLFIDEHFVVWKSFADAIKNKMCFGAIARDRARQRAIAFPSRVIAFPLRFSSEENFVLNKSANTTLNMKFHFFKIKIIIEKIIKKFLINTCFYIPHNDFNVTSLKIFKIAIAMGLSHSYTRHFFVPTHLSDLSVFDGRVTFITQIYTLLC